MFFEYVYIFFYFLTVKDSLFEYKYMLLFVYVWPDIVIVSVFVLYFLLQPFTIFLHTLDVE